jgi:hypothetical protein
MRKLLVMFFLTVFTIISCKPGDITSRVKKGHLEQSPKITFEELVKRYQFIDKSTIKWNPMTDANKNEFIEVSAHFDKGQGLKILFNNFISSVESGMMDSSILVQKNYEFFESLLNEKGFKSEDDSSSFMSLRFNMFEPDYGNPSASDFFNCNGGTFILKSTVDKNGQVKIEKATLIFDMQSPMRYSGSTVIYKLIYQLDVKTAANMLINNTDISGE